MKITVLTYVDPADGRDAVVDQVADALRAHHQVDVLEVHADVDELVQGLREQKPDLVFNLCEMFGDDSQRARRRRLGTRPGEPWHHVAMVAGAL